MKLRFTPWRIFWLSLAIILFAAWYVPRISAARYRGPIQQALEKALGRKVVIGAVKFRLLLTPGFTVEDVRIGEDPAIGPEFVAYIGTLRAVPAISSLFGGPLAFYSVDLDDTSINLTRVESPESGVRWNMSSLMRPALLETFPGVHMHGGRINFKAGDTKSIFYLLGTDVDLWPPTGENKPWTFRARTEVARTDRPARGFGSFTGRGEWYPSTSAVTLDLKLEKSQLGEVLNLFAGQDAGVRGEIRGEAHLAGPSNRIGIRAHFDLADVHSWELAPQRQGTWPVSIGGVIDIPGESAALRATGDQAPVEIRYRVSDYLKRPRWGMTANFAKLPMAPLVGIARNMGLSIPQNLAVSGTVEGAVGYSVADGEGKTSGQIRMLQTTVGVPGTPPLRAETADLRFSGMTASLGPAEVKNDHDETATLTGSYDFSQQHFELGIATKGMQIASLSKQISLAGAPVLGQATAGLWRGNLQYSNAPAGWRGDLELEDTAIPFEAFTRPLQIIHADVAIDGATVAMKKLSLRLGTLQAFGDYKYESSDPRPHRFHITIPEASGTDLEALLQPALKRGNLFTYAFNFGRAPQPDWLRAMSADGTLQIGTLRLLEDMPLTKVHARVLWSGTQVRLVNLQALSGKASLSGTASADLRQRKPAYRLTGTVTGLPWRSGLAGVEGELETSGLGAELLANLKAKGSFKGKGLDISPLDVLASADGSFDCTWDGRHPKVKLSQLALSGEESSWSGTGETQDDGQLLLKLSDGSKQVQAVGPIWKPGAFKPALP